MLDQLLGVAGILILLTWATRRRLHETLLPRIEPYFREDAVILAALAYFGAALLLSALVKAVGLDPANIVAGIIVNNGSQLCGVAACAALAMQHLSGGVRTFLLGNPATLEDQRTNSLAFGFAILLVGVGVCPIIRDATAWSIMHLTPNYPLSDHPTLKALEAGGLSGLEVAGLWIGAALIAPVAEEMFFRGLLQNYLAGGMQRTGRAIALSAVAFGMVHISQPHAVPALMFLGLLLGAAYARTGRLTVPIAIHAAFNLKTLVWEALDHSGSAV